MQDFSTCQITCEFKILLYLKGKPVVNGLVNRQINETPMHSVASVALFH